MLTLRLRAFHLALAVLAVGAIAVAAPLASASGLAHWFKGGFWAGSAASQAVAANKVTGMFHMQQDYNFAKPLDAGLLIVGPTVTVTGAAAGDTCLVSADLTQWVTGDQVVCQATAANTVKVYMVSASGLLETRDPPDAGFFIEVISHQ